jgi:hypothetical protein
MSNDNNFLESSQDQQGIYSRKRRIFALIQQAAIGNEVLAELLPSGKPHLFEKSLWDYKEELPILPAAPTPAQIEAHNAKMAAVVKDVVAFYNTLGGYLIAGIKDNPRTVVGFSGQFDCGDLIKRTNGATQHNVGCHYSVLEVQVGTTNLSLGLLHIPRRPDDTDPAQFRKDSPPNPNGKQAFKRGEIYLRDGDQCRPAVSPEDYTVLCSPGRRQIQASSNSLAAKVTWRTSGSGSATAIARQNSWPDWAVLGKPPSLGSSPKTSVAAPQWGSKP